VKRLPVVQKLKPIKDIMNTQSTANGDKVKTVVRNCLNLLRLPARLDANQTATILGFKPEDIPTLIRDNLLKPLGKPTKNGRKYFSAHDVERLSGDREQLSKATLSVSLYWQKRNERKNKAKSPGTPKSRLHLSTQVNY
jgi:hypothetical protein